MKIVRRCSLPFTLVVAVACGGETPVANAPVTKSPVAATKPAAAKPDPRTARLAKAQFESLCTTCHGATGHGDGPGAATLEPKPRSFADTAWQASVTDEQIKKAIVFGGAAVGKSPMMPAQPQLKSDAALLDGLVQIVRSFKAK
jgi:mono/diheme cytochrome c family protein